MKNDRRGFLRMAATAALAAAACGGGNSLPAEAGAAGFRRAARKGLKAGISISKGGDAAAMVRAAVAALGGLEKIVKKGARVLIKPNMSWARKPEQAATTNPDVVAEVVRLVKAAGAGRIVVADNTCNTAKICYEMSGIAAAAQEAGATVPFLKSSAYRPVKMPSIGGDSPFPEWEVAEEALDADLIINIPIAKHHALSRVTLGFKNMMGLVGSSRGDWHKNISHSILSLHGILRPELTILDATRVLMDHGPQGGRLDDVKSPGIIAASTDPFAVEFFGCELLGAKPEDVPVIRFARERKMPEVMEGARAERINAAI